MKFKKEIFFWFGFLFFFVCLFMIQTLVFQGEVLQVYSPYIFIPFLVFFFLHYKTFYSIGLCFFIGFVSSAFSFLSAPSLTFLFLSFFFFIWFIKQIFFYKSEVLFFILVFLFSFFLPVLTYFFHGLLKSDFFFLKSDYFIKAFTTFLISFLFFPFLKKYLKKQDV